MEPALGDLLDFMDKKYPHETFFSELVKEGFSNEIISESYDKDFIANTHPNRRTGIMGWGKGDGLVLTSNGFLSLNQIRIKRATERLNDSIVSFDNSSRKNSKIMIWLTWTILGLTIVLAIPIIYQVVTWLISILTK